MRHVLKSFLGYPDWNMMAKQLMTSKGSKATNFTSVRVPISISATSGTQHLPPSRQRLQQTGVSPLQLGGSSELSPGLYLVSQQHHPPPMHTPRGSWMSAMMMMGKKTGF